MNGPVPSVRGHSVVNRPAGWKSFTAALLIDIMAAASIYYLVQQAAGAPPVPRATDGAFLLLVYAVLLLTFQALFTATPGFALWNIRWLTRSGTPVRLPTRSALRGSGLYSTAGVEPARAAFALAVTAAIPVLLFQFLQNELQSHPLWMSAENRELQPYMPSTPESRASWTPAAFFYSLGMWPKSFEGRPILYSLPYAKGPPQQFVPSIVARWESPEIRLIIEGPKTPGAFQARPLESVRAIRECLSSAPWESSSSGETCVRVREVALLRHIHEMRDVQPAEWTLGWFEVGNTALTEGERPRGIHLTAVGAERSQDRFILINGNGTHQAFILERPNGQRGDLARMMLEQAIRSQRVFQDLNATRAWSDRNLAGMRVTQLEKLQGSPNFVAKVSEIHLALLSKISVDPKTFDTYFHLAGTSLMLARHAASRRNSEWTAVAKPLVQSAQRYAKDVAPGDRRLGQLENIWLDAKKL